jgi:alkylation response protein AidB-like acyl-CoA dehydrogenase
MPVYKAPNRDFKFLIEDVLNIPQYRNLQGFADALDMMEPVLDAGAQLCEEVLFPLNQSGDAEGVKHDKATGAVTLPKGFKEAYKAFREGGWSAFTCDTKYGGQGLPEWLYMPVLEMVCSANLSFGITPGLSHGAYNAIHLHASDVLKDKYLPKLVSGEWSGVMCLTEPQCGTDLGLIRTKAEPRADGSYAISGTKIFISSGDQDVTENILHLILARLPDAPAGIKGISLFLAPKFMVDDSGKLGAQNGIKCASIEHKMGIHASPTCVMNYDNAVGWLVGEPHKGMRAMFTMMNAARLYVGVQGLGLAEVAYQNALAYAKERLQMRSIKGAKFPDKPADPIIVHPDVRKMLLTSKAFCEGARALAMETALKLDIAHRSNDKQVKQDADDFVQLMTPIVKAYLTDGGFDIANLAVQVHGGYGYVKEYGVEQYVRDARIAQIYEGTNGIQALDLVGRKLPAHTGRYLRQFFHPVDTFITAHKDSVHMQEFLKPLSKNIGYLQQASLYIARAGLVNPEDGAAAATDYLRMFALVVMAFYWARMADAAHKNMDKDKAFYTDKLATARFFYAKILPQVSGLGLTLPSGSKPLMEAVL